MAHLIKQLPPLSSKNIHIKPVIRAWNPVGVTIYTTKENKVTSKTSQLCGMNRKEGQVGISETGRKKGGVWRLPEVEKGGPCSTHVSLQRRV